MTTATKTKTTNRGGDDMETNTMQAAPMAAAELREKAGPLLHRLAAIRAAIARLLREDQYLAGTPWEHRLTKSGSATTDTQTRRRQLTYEREVLRGDLADLCRRTERQVQAAALSARQVSAAERALLDAQAMDAAQQSRAVSLAMHGNAPDLLARARAAIRGQDAGEAQVLAHAAVLAGAGRSAVTDLARALAGLLDRTDPRYRAIAERAAAANASGIEAVQVIREVRVLTSALGLDPETEHPRAAETTDAGGRPSPTPEKLLELWDAASPAA